jgi:hypothetical protein
VSDSRAPSIKFNNYIGCKYAGVSNSVAPVVLNNIVVVVGLVGVDVGMALGAVVGVGAVAGVGTGVAVGGAAGVGAGVAVGAVAVAEVVAVVVAFMALDRVTLIY